MTRTKVNVKELEVLNKLQTCEYLQISKPKLLQLTRRHGLRTVKLGPRSERYLRSDLDALMAKLKGVETAAAG